MQCPLLPHLAVACFWVHCVINTYPTCKDLDLGRPPVSAWRTYTLWHFCSRTCAETVVGRKALPGSQPAQEAVPPAPPPKPGSREVGQGGSEDLSRGQQMGVEEGRGRPLMLGIFQKLEPSDSFWKGKFLLSLRYTHSFPKFPPHFQELPKG